MRKPLSDQQFGLILIIPSLIVLALVALYPLISNIYASFFDNGAFVWLNQYRTLFRDERFIQSFLNTVLFCVISVPLELIFGLIIALVLHRSFIGRGMVRAASILPWALPTAVIAVGWKWIFNDTYGVINDLLIRMHLIKEPLAWLGKPGLAFFCIIVAEVWKCTPFVAIILLAGLQSIPDEIYESVSVDGAGFWQTLRSITLPLLKPFICVALVFRGIQAMGVFDSIWVMTGGGPAGATEPVSMYIYDTVFRYLNLNYASAITVVSFLFSLAIVVLLYFVLMRGNNES
ncbi:carbohydrate ABC transporter permease [Candidatus Auribacterota bacterium]